MAQSRYIGFTLLEMLIVIAIVAILAVASGVGLSYQIKRAKVRQAATQLAADIEASRQLATSQYRFVHLCSAAGCDQSQWSLGWQIQRQAAESVALYKPPRGMRITKNNHPSLSFSPIGATHNTLGTTFKLCLGAAGKKIVVNSMGRVRLEALVCE